MKTFKIVMLYATLTLFLPLFLMFALGPGILLTYYYVNFGFVWTLFCGVAALPAILFDILWFPGIPVFSLFG